MKIHKSKVEQNRKRCYCRHCCCCCYNYDNWDDIVSLTNLSFQYLYLCSQTTNTSKLGICVLVNYQGTFWRVISHKFCLSSLCWSPPNLYTVFGRPFRRNIPVHCRNLQVLLCGFCYNVNLLYNDFCISLFLSLESG